MKSKLFLAVGLTVALASCNKEKQATTEQNTPVVGEKIVVPVVPPLVAPPVVAVAPDPVPTPVEEEIGVEEPMVTESEVVIGEEPSATPGQHLDNAIQQTGKGLQRLGEKIERKANEAGR